MNDDLTTQQTIRNFLASEKPPCINPVDILQMIGFMAAKAEDHAVLYSQQTLARRYATDTKTIARSQRRLASPEVDWISIVRNRGKTSSISVKYQNIPAESPLRLKISPEAKVFAFRYQRGLQKLGRKKFPRQWLEQQHVSAQRILNACEGDFELAVKLVGHALAHPSHCKKARQSLYHVYGRWEKILATYSEKLKGEFAASQEKLEHPPLAGTP